MAIFFAGGLLASFNVQPFPALKQGWRDTVQLLSETRQTRPSLLEPSPYPGEGVVVHTAGATQPGYTMIQGLMPGGAQIRMIDLDGREIHRWKVDFFEIWSDPDHVQPAANLPKSDINYHTQGFWPLPDGSVVVNVSEYGAVRLDRCSRPVWTVDRMTHHSVTRTPEGDFWFASHIPLDETPERLLPRGIPRESIEAALVGYLRNYNNSILLVSEDGEILKEFSVLEAVTDAGLEHALFTSMLEFIPDPTHLNDVEVVTGTLAAKIDDVAPGDLLVSLRSMNMLAILDQHDGRLKWHRQGPWVHQHDPDVMPDGTIEIFNNRKTAIGDWVTGSQIVSYDAETDRTEILHPTGETDLFHSDIMGDHQRLENGNILIAESLAGRLLEATPEGEVVWDYRLPYDDEVASLFERATRVSTEYFETDSWTCTEN